MWRILFLGIAYGESRGSQRLIDAIRKFQGEEFLDESQGFTDYDAWDAKHKTALFWAVSKGELKLVTRLLELGASVDIPNSFGVTPLMAASEQYIHITEVLLDACPDLYLKDESSKPQTAFDGASSEPIKKLLLSAEIPLIGAVRRNSTRGVLNVLGGCKGKIDIEEKDSSGKTALMWATDESLTEIVPLLVQHGANFVTELLDSTQRGHLGLVNAFIAGGANINEMYEGQGALIKAVKKKHTEMVSALLDASGFVDQLYSDGTWTDYTLLMSAARDGNVEIVRLLDASCADLDIKDSSGRTALAVASNAEVQDLLRNAAWPLVMGIRRKAIDPATLLNVGQVLDANRCNRVSIDATDDKGMSALMVAAENNLIPTIQDLLARKPRIDLQSPADGKTALMKAAQVGVEVTKLLVEACANLDVEDHAGKKALDYATHQIYTMLASRKWPLIGAIRHKIPDIQKYLAEYEEDCPDAYSDLHVNAADNTGMTALMVASKDNNSATVAQLLVLKPDLDLRCLAANGCSGSDISRTALMMAADAGLTEIVRLLIGGCANLDLEADGHTSLDLARAGHHNGVVELLETAKWPLIIAIRTHNPMMSNVAGFIADEEAICPHAGANLNIDATDHTGMTALIVASKDNNGAIVAQLLALKPDLDVRCLAANGCSGNDTARTALMMAAADGLTEIVRLLIGGCANLDLEAGGHTSLDLARAGHHNGVVELLETAKWPLTAAIRAKNPELSDVAGFIAKQKATCPDAGADLNINATDYTGMTALMLVSKNGDSAIVAQLLDLHADLSARCPLRNGCSTDVNRTALMMAVEGGFHEVVREFLHKCANVDAAFALVHKTEHPEVYKLLEHAKWPLVSAVRRAVNENILNFDANKYLQNCDGAVDINVLDGRHVSALMVASRGNRSDIVQQLLDLGANVEVTDPEGCTALVMAAKDGYEKVTEKLLAKEADINVACGAQQRTVLMNAVTGAHHSVIRQLLDTCVDIDAVDSGNETALTHAQSLGANNISDLLTGAHWPLIGAILRHDSPGVPAIMGDEARCTKEEKDINQVDNTSSTPLIWAVRENQDATLDRILDENTVKVDHKDENQSTALHWAARNGNVGTMTKLLDHNAFVDSQDKDGFTPLMYVAKEGNGAGVQTLLAKHANVKLKNTDEKTAFQLARENNHRNIAQVLTLRDPTTVRPSTTTTSTSQAFMASPKPIAIIVTPKATVKSSGKVDTSPNLLLLGLLSLVIPISCVAAYFTHAPTRKCVKGICYIGRPVSL